MRPGLPALRRGVPQDSRDGLTGGHGRSDFAMMMREHHKSAGAEAAAKTERK
jgi:hypothetical protein